MDKAGSSVAGSEGATSVKRKSLLVAFWFCMIGIQQVVLADEFHLCSLSTMTYNVRAAINLGSAAQGLEKIARTIEVAGKPDVLMLQEVMRFDPLVDYIDEFQWLKDRLGYRYGYFTSGQADPVPPGTAEWGNAIYLGSDTGSVVGSQKYLIGWNRSLCRVTVSIQGTTVHFFCTHTGSGAVAEQVQTITGILDDYTALKQPVILGGDFNAFAYDSAMAPLRQILEDVFIKLSIPVNSIDTFYVSPEVTTHAAEVFHDVTYASDHDPVACVLSPWSPLPGPVITQQPQTQDRCPGDTVAFTAAASGNGTLSYQWQRDRVSMTDGGRVSGATSPNLTLSNVDSSDIASYRCVVTDGDCSRATGDVVLTLTPTAMVTQPSGQTVGEGGTAILSVVAKGAGTLSYQWQKNGADLADDGRIVGANSASLQIANCNSSDQADYRCVVSGYCGTQTSNAATLTVESEPPVSFYEDWDDYAEGRNDPAYVARWQTIPGTLRYEIWVGNYDEFSPPNSAQVSLDNDPTGITHPLAPELTTVVPGADQVRGTDADPLALLVKLYLQYTSDRINSDVFAELSMGDVHVTAGNSATVRPVLAFGMTAGMHGAAAYPRFFDGKNWNNVTGVTIGGGHNDLKMTVRTTSVQLQGLRSAVGSATLTRLYTGGFDRISLRTVYNTVKWRSISDVSLTGGAVKAPLAVSAGPDKEIRLGGATVLEGSVSGGTPPYTIQWSPATGLDNPQLLRPTASPSITTVYTLTVTDSVNNSKSDSVLVTMSGLPIPCDFDLDGDVDQEDFGVLQSCLGVSNASQHPTCWVSDLNKNGSVTASDITLFLGCMTGPGIAGDVNCPP
jgi:endonuclease/exonuclease/phosphatase family metal-dependent hydrolase